MKNNLKNRLEPARCFVRMVSSILLLGAVSLGLAACASGKPEGELTGTVSSLYNEGLDKVQAGQYVQAVHSFEELERQYPYSGWATRGQMMTAYAHYRNGAYDEALVTIDRFLQLHPAHPDLAYMFYLKGMSHYAQMTDVNRDQANTREALAAFEALVNRFPDSVYARDARLKVTLCLDHLAGKEMVVGRYYLAQQQYLAAIGRFDEVVKQYPRSSQTPEALYRLVESYLALGVTDEATRAAAILGHNYPANDWYQKAYALLTDRNLAPKGASRTWAGTVWQGVKEIF
jgi:outer membrane protein assembly factor BamD